MKQLWSTEEEAQRLGERFAGVKQAEFARVHQIPGGASMVSQHIKGRRPIGLEAAVAYARGFNCLLADISPRLAAEVRSAAPLLERNTGDTSTFFTGANSGWRAAASPRAQLVIDLLVLAAQEHHLEDADWQCLELMALRLRAAQAATAATDGPARVKPEFQEELDHMVRSAEERRDQEQKQPKQPKRRALSGQ